MEGLIPIHSKYECKEEAETVFEILCSKAKLPETINCVDVSHFAKMADVLFQGVDPMIKIALKVHHLSGVSKIISKELEEYVEFPMFPNYRRHGKLARRFGQNCDICGAEKYALWATRFYTRRAEVCLDCIKSGKAGKENKGFIYEAYMMRDSDLLGKEEVYEDACSDDEIKAR